MVIIIISICISFIITIHTLINIYKEEKEKDRKAFLAAIDLACQGRLFEVLKSKKEKLR